MHPTIHDIAERAGVSLTTVSRALNNKPDISKDTRGRILAIAQEVGYTPNLHARALASGKSKTLGLIIADSANPYYGRLIRGVEDTANDYGYGVILCNTYEDRERDAIAHQMLREKRVDGVLITSTPNGSSALRSFARHNIPYVLINRCLGDLQADCVLHDQLRGAHQAIALLCQLGHRRIMHLTGPPEIWSVSERLAGYQQALQEHGISFAPQWLVHSEEVTMQGGYEAAKAALVSLSPRPTAIFAFSDLLALGVLKALRELGLRVPQDVALVGYDDIEFAALVDPPLTTVVQQAYELGKKATEILLEKICWPEEKEWTPRRLVLEPELRIRASSGSSLV